MPNIVTPADDYFHDPGTNPYYNESTAQYFWIPERNIQGLLYMWFRPNMKCAFSQLNIWDGQFNNKADILFYDTYEWNPMPEGCEMFDFELDSGLKCELIEPLERYHWTYKNHGCELELVYSPHTPIYSRHNEAGEAGTMGEEFKAWCDTDTDPNGGNYSRGSRVEGQLKLEGETIEIDCFGWRDHSWGPRKPFSHAWRRGAVNIAIGETAAFDAWCVSDYDDPEEDPLLGTTERAVLGMHWKDGIMSPLVAGVHRTLERNENEEPLRVEVEAVDKHGRDFHAIGECKSWYRWHGLQVAEILSCTEWTFDGITTHGDHEEFRNFRQARRLARMIRDRASKV